MIDFKRKKLDSIETLGEKFFRLRQDRGISLDRAARKLQINALYLKALESNTYEDLPADVYTQHFIRRYAKLLNISAGTALAAYDQERTLYFKTKRSTHAPKPTPRSRLMKLIVFFLKPSTIRYSIAIILFLFITIYIGLSINNIFSPPELIIKNPAENQIITTDQVVEISGVTEKEALLTINSREVTIGPDGGFDLRLDLQKGLNIIKISSKKKHSQAHIEYRQIIVNDKITE
jgi:cytoskeletal protein RodZ